MKKQGIKCFSKLKLKRGKWENIWTKACKCTCILSLCLFWQNLIKVRTHLFSATEKKISIGSLYCYEFMRNFWIIWSMAMIRILDNISFLLTFSCYFKIYLNPLWWRRQRQVYSLERGEDQKLRKRGAAVMSWRFLYDCLGNRWPSEKLCLQIFEVLDIRLGK